MAEISGCSKTITQLTQITGCTDFDSSFLLIGVDTLNGETKSITANILFDCLGEGCLWSAGTNYVGYKSIQQPDTEGTNEATGPGTLAVGGGTKSTGMYSMSQGGGENGDVISSGYASFAGGYISRSSAIGSLAFGHGAYASGDGSVALGGYDGGGVYATKQNSFAGGFFAISSGITSFAFGGNANAIGDYSVSFAGGEEGPAMSNARGSFSLGFNVYANGDYSTVISNFSTTAANYSSIIGGQNNTLDSSATNSAIIGGENISGTSSNTLYCDNIITTNTIGVGVLVPDAALHIAAPISGTGQFQNSILLDAFSNNATSPSNLVLRRARGTKTTPTALLKGDNFGAVTMRGYGSTAYSNPSRIRINGYADENWTDSAQGSYLTIYTTQTGTTTTSERLRITSAGNIGMGTTTPLGKLDISTGNGIGLVVGANSGSDVRSDNTNKLGRIATAHYVNNEEPMAMLFGNTQVDNNYLYVGGGSSFMNTATDIIFSTATGTTETIGTIRMSINKDGYIGMGTTTPISILHVSSDEIGDNGTVTFDRYYSTYNTPSALVLRKARGTKASPTSVITGDNIGVISMRGYGSTAFPSVGKIRIAGWAAEDWTDSNQGSYLTFYTTPTGSTIATEVVKIEQNGDVIFSGDVTSTGYIHGVKCGAFAYLASAATTTITSGSTFYPINGVFVNSPAEQFSGTSTPALQYTGTKTQYFEIDWHSSVKSNHASCTVTFGIKINGILATPSLMSTFLKTQGELFNLSGTVIVELNQYDEVQLVVTCDSSGDVLTVNNYVTSINEFFD